MYSNEHDFKIPLSLKGVTSCFQTRTPTNFEVETCKWIVLSDDNQWDPHSDAFQENEENFSALQETAMPNRAIFSIKTSNNFKLNLDTDMAEISKALDDKYLISIAATNTTDRRCNIDAEKIASSWNIGLEAAKKTIRCTTQKGVRNVSHPVERRFRTRQAQLHYRQLSGRHGKFYTNTFFSSSATLNGCKMAQLYTNDLSFIKIYPMKAKSEVPDSLSKFLYEVGIPNAIHSDDAPEQCMGVSNRSARNMV